MLSSLKNTINTLQDRIYSDLQKEYNHQKQKEIIRANYKNNVGMQDLKMFHEKLTSYKRK